VTPRLPQLTASEVVAFLRRNGFAPVRQKGSHLTLWSEERGTAVTIPVHSGCDLGRGLVVRILKDAGFSIDDFLREN
jgi:predicted RNA binding protein YcfA (HicA-like mRNA interferase family)